MRNHRALAVFVAAAGVHLASARGALAQPMVPDAPGAVAPGPSREAPAAGAATVHPAPVSAAGADVSLGASSAAPAASESTLADAPVPDAPPPLPHKHGLVLEQSLGALGFGGQFRHVAPVGLWLHTQLGYEVLKWLTPFVEGEVTLTDTSEVDDPSKVHAFPILGFGGGVRARISLGDRVGVFGQLDVGAMKADIPKNTLGILGFRDAESFNPYFGGRLGVDWLQIDRHLALLAMIGVRDAQGFAKLAASSDTGVLWDASVAIRYTF